LEIEWAPQDFAPPAAPLNVAPFLPAINSLLVGAPSDWAGEAPHPVPRRQIFCVLRGAMEVTASDGDVRSFRAGDILFAEDTWGKGHSTRIISQDDAMFFVTPLRDS
jgi:hypothetical protein